MSLYARLCKAASQLKRSNGLDPYADRVETVSVMPLPNEGGVVISVDDDTRACVDYVLPPEVAEQLLIDLAAWKVARSAVLN